MKVNTWLQTFRVKYKNVLKIGSTLSCLLTIYIDFQSGQGWLQTNFLKVYLGSSIKNIVDASIAVVSQIIHMHVRSNFFHQKCIFWFSSDLLDSQDYRDVWGNLFYLRYPVFDIIHSIFKRSFTDDNNVLEKK